VDADTIARIETFPLRIPFRAGGRPPVDSLLVKVTTSEGREGWGEAFGFEATPVTRRAVEDLIAPLCTGQEAALIGPLMRTVQQQLMIFGRGGLVIHALSAVDTALWDIAGKVAGLPLHQLLGGGGRPAWTPAATPRRSAAPSGRPWTPGSATSSCTSGKSPRYAPPARRPATPSR
jgi:L-alanine-DL-glutamate epimerase-like enolase superfamily enzyme